MSELIHDLIAASARRAPNKVALVYQKQTVTFTALDHAVSAAANLFLAHGLEKSARVATFIEKRVENIVGMFGAARAGGVFVPINPLLKGEQVVHIMNDCNVRLLVTSFDRLKLLAPYVKNCPDLKAVIVVDRVNDAPFELPNLKIIDWETGLAESPKRTSHRVIDGDMAAILYTSGSTGKPKGVVLSHRNIAAGANSVAEYLELSAEDRILSVLPLSFDYGLNQITTAFLVGATAVLMNYLFPRDVIKAVAEEKITGLAAVPPLWVQLAQLPWPDAVVDHLRYVTNSGGHMPEPTLKALRRALPKTKPFLMYGLTEAFRSTFLPPEQVDNRPDSIGKAIPNAEILVVREDGTECAANEPGELVHRGVHVSLGYWNDVEKTAERFKPAPGQLSGLVMPEMAVWSGDTVKRDEEGFLYFISRRDEMIKTSGYRVSPTEVEEVIYATGLVSEVAAFGVAHPTLGQAIVVVVMPKSSQPLSPEALLAAAKVELPAFMVPHKIIVSAESLPRNPNGKIDRKVLAQGAQDLFETAKT
jgi:acyl-CoA ligase (AMP-forming) (exosortase A-associated)